MTWLTKRLPWLLLAASAALFFLPLGGRALWNSDEGRYAEIAREMLELKDWISPHLNYVLYFEKPPLMYWLTAASLAVFGQTEFAARFWCAAFGTLTVGVVYLIGKRWRNEQTGLFAGSVLATSLGFFCLTQYLVLDMALTFWMTLAMYAGMRILQERPPEKVRRFADFLALAVAGGFLTKGLIALLFPVVVLGLTIAYTRLGLQVRKIAWLPVLILLAILIGPWFALVSMQHPFFLPFFFIHEHFSRFLTTVHRRTAPVYFYIPVLLGGFLPWSVFVPALFRRAFEHRGQSMKRDPALALFVIWCLFIFFFFSMAQSKLAGYLLPIFPALALMVGSAFQDAIDEEDLPAWIQGGTVALILVLVTGLIVLKLPLAEAFFKDPIAAVFHAHADALCLMLGIGVFILVGVWGMHRVWACLSGIMVVQVLLLGTLTCLAPVLDPYLSNRGLAQSLDLLSKPDEPIVAYGLSYEDVLQSLPFYTRRRIIIHGNPGELELGRQHSADAGEWFVPDPGAAAALRTLPLHSWVVTSEESAKYLRQAGSLDAFDLAAREGFLLLFRRVR